MAILLHADTMARDGETSMRIYTDRGSFIHYLCFAVFQYNNGQNGSSQRLEDKVRKLEADKDNLTLQVSVLSDQIEAQVEKIRDLERSLRISHSNKSSVNGHREVRLSREGCVWG